MISISVCMIVKNEEEVLERCLQSLAGLYEELIIVDTGSEDRTRGIARQYTDRVYDYVWDQDFSAARNYAFSKATCDFVWSVDADEVLDQENRQKVIALKEALLPEIEIVQVYYRNKTGHNATENYACEYRPKLYRRVREFRWIEPVHEMVNLQPVVFDSDIIVDHMPKEHHAQRDYGVYQRAFERGDTFSARMRHMYARELYIAGKEEDFREAEPIFASLYEGMSQTDASYEEYLEIFIVLARVYRITKRVDDFFATCLRCFDTTKPAEICVELGRYFEDQKNYAEAAIWYHTALTEAVSRLDIRSGKEIPEERLSFCTNYDKEIVR